MLGVTARLSTLSYCSTLHALPIRRFNNIPVRVRAFSGSGSGSIPPIPKRKSKFDSCGGSGSGSGNSKVVDEAVDVSKLFVAPGVERDGISRNKVLPGSNIVVGPYAGDARVKQVEFVKSSERPKDCPRDGRPEIALLGRSNVGKSSLINSLVRSKGLAMTSKRPGKTRLINHFLVNKSWYLVDLPGYGYADAPDSARSSWNQFTKGFFLNRDTIVVALLLIDASIPPQKIDIDCAFWLDKIQVPFTFVFTKCDKRKSSKTGALKPEENIADFQDMINRYYRETPPWIMTSSVTNLGRDELLLHMSQLRNYWDQ